jgi:hypothetical protein
MDSVKKCTKCGKELSLDQFYQRSQPLRSGAPGYVSECKNCSSIRSAEWRAANPEKCRIRRIKWSKNNPEKCKIKKAKHKKRRRVSDINFRIGDNIRNAVNVALKGNYKAGHTIELLGCSVEYLHQYLENQFIDDMGWDNYGVHGWHIDHIIPLSYFDMSDPEQQKRAWHYTNLRPLWADDNLKKSNKIEERQLLLL